MKYISYYNSPLGKILLASDEIGLFGAWFKNQKYYADIDLGDAFSEENDTLNKAKNGLITTFKNSKIILIFLCILLELNFKKKYGKFFLPFHMAKQQHMEK